MAKHNDTGLLGEEIATQYLEAKGYQIVDRNWRWGKGEVDLIAKQADCLVFVEVKTRTKSAFGYPEAAVGAKKQQLFYELATEYMYQIQHEAEFRFDIVSIVLQPKQEIKHFQDAFFPDW